MRRLNQMSNFSRTFDWISRISDSYLLELISSFINIVIAIIIIIIIYMKKLLDSDWLRAVQFKCNTNAKSVTPVQKV